MHQDDYVSDQQREYVAFMREASGRFTMLPRHYFDLPKHLRGRYWGRRCDDPRRYPGFCAKQARRTPEIPWHNSTPCLACGRA